MKTLVTIILVGAILSGCGKVNDVKPAKNDVTKSKTEAAVTDSVLKLNAADLLHKVFFYADPQQVKTNVSGKTLTLKFNENVNLFLTSDGYNQTSAIHLFEDFTKSSLINFDYTTVAQMGNVTFNWVDNNLNNVILKTVKDTVISGKNIVKINVHRTFTFTKVYDSAQMATLQQDYLLNSKQDYISFSSFCYYNQKNYPNSAFTANLVYVK
ncbi:hypothetical protein BH09BAC6_BH09BAC6_04290 [soil metagenome]|jgi:hypothetical protein